MDVKELYKANYETSQELLSRTDTKYHWAAFNVFGLTTYDGELDELFVKDIIEVCKVIFDRTNYEYILNRENYIKYVLVCQMLDKHNWINWGSSIRGAWFDRSGCLGIESKDIMDELEWWDYNLEEPHCVIEKVPFTEENLKALIEFIEE